MKSDDEPDKRGRSACFYRTSEAAESRTALEENERMSSVPKERILLLNATKKLTEGRGWEVNEDERKIHRRGEDAE